MMVFFDIGATLIDGPAETPARQFARYLGLADSARRRLDSELLTGKADTDRALLRLLVDEYGTEPTRTATAVNDVLASQLTGPVAIAGATELLAALRDADVSYGFISNNWAPYANQFFRLFGALAVDRPCAFSYRLGITKPSPGIYQAAIAAAGIAADHCIMIGDSYDNDMAPALAAGMRTIWVMHRPDKERPFMEGIAAGRLTPPDLTVPLISGLPLSAICTLVMQSKEAAR